VLSVARLVARERKGHLCALGSDHGGGGVGQAAAPEPAIGQLDVIQTPLLTVGHDLNFIDMARGERHPLSSPRGSTGRLRARQRHRLGRRALALVEPLLGVQPSLRLERSAFVEIAEAIDEGLGRASPARAAFVGRDRSKADEFSEIARALERESAARAQLVEKIGGVIGVVNAGLAGQALEVGQQDLPLGFTSNYT
jgi:hypothetical protein